MTRRRAKPSRQVSADLLQGWLPAVPRGQPSQQSAKGLFDVPALTVDQTADEPANRLEADVPQILTSYTVHCYVTVCVKLTGIVAGSHREAAKLAQERFDWNAHDGEVEFVDELHEMLVDVAGDPDYSRSVAFTADLEPVY